MENQVTASGPQGIYVLRLPPDVILSQEEMVAVLKVFRASLEHGIMVVEYGATVEWVGPGAKPRPSVWQRLRARLGR